MESTTQHKSDAELSNSSLLFVYNADTGLFSVVTDYAHKILSPKTYPCNLCAITYGSMGMNKKWKEFIENLSSPVEFIHRDEFVAQYDLKDTQLPAAFLKKGDNITLFITNDEINKCTTIEELMNLVTGKLGKTE